jgi:putative membrane protein
MTRHLLIAGACALALAACNKAPDEQKGAATPAEQAATPDAHPAATIPTPSNESTATDFAPKAAAGDMFEIAISKLAVSRSKNPEVVAFAKKMIAAHTKSTEGLKKAIGDSGATVTLPTVLPDDLQGKVDDLTKADAKDFDAKFADAQVDAHQGALNLMQRYAQDGDYPAIKTFAADTAPVVQEHLNMAEGLKNGMK